MGVFRRVHGVTRRDQLRSCEICKTLNFRSLHAIERVQLRWFFGHLIRIPKRKLARLTLSDAATGNPHSGRPSARWRYYAAKLPCSSLHGAVPAKQ